MRNKNLVFTATYNEVENIDKFLNLKYGMTDFKDNGCIVTRNVQAH